MKCLKNYTIEHVKEMSNEELLTLFNKFREEIAAENIRAELIKHIEIMEAKGQTIAG